jgi:tetratricopeptide (TPR) repeat protein
MLKCRSAGRTLLWFVLIIVIGAVFGFVGGWIVWYIFGQIQIFLHLEFPYAAMYSPPLLYEAAWTIGLPIYLLFQLGKGRRNVKRLPSRPMQKSTVMQQLERTTEAKEFERKQNQQQMELQIEQSPDDADLHLKLARTLRPATAYVPLRLRRNEEVLRAEAEYSKAIQLKPNMADAHLELGMLYYSHMWDVAQGQREALALKAEKELREAIRIDPSISEAHKALALVLRFLSRREEAIEELVKTLQLKPSDKLALFWLGTILQDLGKTEESTSSFRQIFTEYEPSLHKIERTELSSDFYTGKIHVLGLILQDRINKKSIKVERLENLEWID